MKTSADVIKALRKRYDANGWLLFEQVSNGTGGRASNWADAVAMSVWPSRGLEIHGFEVKVHRNDVLRELKRPDKAESVARYCDYWWMAVNSADLAKPEELPPAWGLLVPKAGKIHVAKPAHKLECKSVDRDFVAAMLRRAHECYDPERLRHQIVAELRMEAYAEAEKKVAKDHDLLVAEFEHRLDTMSKDNDRLRRQLHAMSNGEYPVDQIRQAVELLHRLRGWNSVTNQLETSEKALHRLREIIDPACETLRNVAALAASLGDEKKP